MVILIVIFYVYIKNPNINRTYDFYETHYSSIVANSGVQPAFTELKDKFGNDIFFFTSGYFRAKAYEYIGTLNTKKK